MDEELLRATGSIRGVVCTPAGTALTIRRASDGGWELPGGRIRTGEDVTECLRRELREEVDLDVTIHQPVHAYTWENDDGNDRFAVYYRCSSDPDPVTLSEEHTDSAWVSRATARERLSEPQMTAVSRALQTPRDVPVE